MNDFIFQNTTKICFGRDQMESLGAEAAIGALSDFLYNKLGLASTLTEIGIDDRDFARMAEKACAGGVLHGFTDLTPKDVEAIYRMCL